MSARSHPPIVRWLVLVSAAWGATLLLRLFPLGGVWQDLSVEVWLLLIAWPTAFALGFGAAAVWNPAVPAIAPRESRRWLHRWIAVLSAVAIAGAVLISIEFAVLRGYGFTTPVALIRSAEVESARDGFGGSLVSGIGRLLTPALTIAWLLAIVRWRDLAFTAKAVLIAATITVFVEQTMYEGGRFFLATLVASCFIARALARREGGALPRPADRRPLRTALLAAAVVAVFGYVFLDRAAALELDLSSVYFAYAWTYDVAVGPDVTARLDGGLGPLWFVGAMFWMYITQGPNELAVLLAQEEFVHAFGLYQFPQLGQALARLTGGQVGYDVFTHLQNVGTYPTFAGAGYVDFGYAGSMLQAALLGAVTALAVRAAQAHRLAMLGVSAPLWVTLGLFSPIISLLTNLWPALLWAVLVGCTAGGALRRPRVAALAVTQTP